MARAVFPIVSAVLQWARKRAGYKASELAAYFRDYDDWEQGRGGPTYPQLEALAKRLKVPVAVFFFPEPPESPSIEETFRTLPDKAIDELPSKIRLLLRKAKAFQLNVAELCDGKNPAPRLITRDLTIRPRPAVAAVAAEVRRYLRVDLEEQTSWPSDDEALKRWRDYLEAAGIFTFKDAFEAPGFSGFCLTDKDFPIIYVNNSSSKTRQIFTLFHELAHLLFKTSGIDADSNIGFNSAQSRTIEVACNAFAAEFLLPARVFAQVSRGLPANEQTAIALAQRYRVSRESIFRRFLDRQDISVSTYEEAARRWAADGRSGGDGGNYYRTKLAYLGRSYVGLALAAYRQDRINEDELAQYLDVKPKSLSSLEEYYVSGGAA